VCRFFASKHLSIGHAIGTGFSITQVKEGLSSCVAKLDDPLPVVSDIGTFDSREKLLAFWSKFFTAQSFPEHKWKWFLGR